MLYKLLIMFLFIYSTSYADTLSENLQKHLGDNNTYKESLNELINDLKNLEDVDEASEGKSLALEMLKNKENYISNAAAVYKEDIISNSLNEDNGCVDANKLGTPVLYIFISSTVPTETLKNYAKTISKLDGSGIMVMRGLLDSIDKIKPTLNFITNLSCGKSLDELQKKPEPCEVSRVDINPLLFRAFNVKEVPAIVYSEISYPELMDYINTNKPIDENKYGIIYGDISIEYALERFNEKINADFKSLLNKINPGYFSKTKKESQ